MVLGPSGERRPATGVRYTVDVGMQYQRPATGVRYTVDVGMQYQRVVWGAGPCWPMRPGVAVKPAP